MTSKNHARAKESIFLSEKDHPLLSDDEKREFEKINRPPLWNSIDQIASQEFLFKLWAGKG